ncbi:MAG: AAA family ATPase, partial [Candidatus Melainabacteria bacterium]|nr:AAA family ATPase [Candidatus Melainabacteria bacterium]
MASKLKDLPIGVQTFREMIESLFLYVDKTREIYDLVSKPKAAYFLSRPRRFGKSLLVSTLEAIFKNERELFKGLWLDSSDYEWREYPVIKLDISAVDKNSVEELREGLKRLLVKIAAKYEIKLENLSPSAMLSDLISELAKKHGSKVVVLVDEYDDPIIKHISNPELALQMRDLLHDFYKIIKSEDANIRFVFLTGVSKFSRTSIFSGLNNLSNISMQEKYASIVGITQEELERDFSPYLDLVAEKHKTTKDRILEQLKHWYNGYRFSRAELKVYNPFSTLSLFDTMEFTNFWFATGTPSYLVSLVKQHNPDLAAYDREISVNGDFLNSYDVENVPLIPVLYDTGYLTIKDYSVRNNITRYELAYPNFEVKTSLTESFLRVYGDESRPERISSVTEKLEDFILSNQLADFMDLLKSYFAGIPYELIPVKTLNEKYFHLVFYLLMRVTSFRVNIEDRSSSGRVD